MIPTILTIVACLALIALSQTWWRSHLNPVTIGIIAWLPGLVMLWWPPYFLSPLYIHLNRPVGFLIYLAMGLCFASFWAGCAMVKALSKAEAFRLDPAGLQTRLSVPRAALIAFGGFAVFVYVYVNSGLLELQNLDQAGVAESRLNLHVGPLSFVILFLDVAAIGFFARFMQGRGVLNAVPILIALLCQAATLQKSRFMFLVLACLLIAALHPRAARYLFWRSIPRRLLVAGVAVSVFSALFAMNAARGIAEVQMTAVSSPIVEQIYIYSGAAAIQNVSVTVDGYMPSDPPTYGLYLARPVLWHFVDHDLIFATRYFEGINAASYMIYGWADFRWLGFILTPFLTGVVVMLFLRMALTGNLFGLVLGVIQAQALIFSANTDVIFDPTTLLLIIIALVAYLASYRAVVPRTVPGRPEALPAPEGSQGRGPAPRPLTSAGFRPHLRERPAIGPPFDDD
jgi:hypothetical protein